MARLYQDFSFVVNEVVDRPLMQICGSVDPAASDNAPIVVFLKLARPPEWHRFFLDAGAAFWEIQSDADITEEREDDSVRLVEYFSEILPCKIECATAVESQSSLSSHIIVKLDRRLSIYLTYQDNNVDAPTIISLQPSI